MGFGIGLAAIIAAAIVVAAGTSASLSASAAHQDRKAAASRARTADLMSQDLVKQQKEAAQKAKDEARRKVISKIKGVERDSPINTSSQGLTEEAPVVKTVLGA